MTDFEKNEGFVELPPEALDKAVGGIGDGTYLKTTKKTDVRSGPGRNYKLVGHLGIGTLLKYRGIVQTDEDGVEWTGITYSSSLCYIPSDCCKFI